MDFKAIKSRIGDAIKVARGELQAGPRAAQGNTLNYMSVETLDPVRLARAFAAADQGYITDQATLFELVEERDTHIFSELSKRRRAVTGLGWGLTPKDDATQSEIDRTAELTDMLTSISNFEDAQYDLTDAVGKGIAALELEWKTGETWLPRELVWVPQRMFQISREKGGLQYVRNGVPEPLREWSWIVHQHSAKSGYIEAAALFRVLAWTYAYKTYDVRDMQRFLETYGMPLRLGKYPAGISSEQRDVLLKAVRNIGNDSAGVVPDTMKIDFVEAKGGNVRDFLDAIDYWEKKQSMAILGGTLTSQADGKTSTNALGEIHDKVRREIMLHDVRQIVPTINAQLLKPIALINGMFPEDRLPAFGYLTEETVDQEKMIKVLTQGAEAGMEIDLDYAHKVMQIPRAADGAKKLIVAKPKAPESTPPDTAELARLVALVKEKTGSEDVPGAYVAQLADLCVQFEQELQQEIAAAVAESAGYDELLERIAVLKANPKWAEAMALGMAAASLAGRADVGAGN